MPVLIQIEKAQEEARNNPICLGCNTDKGIGGVVCWTCFKQETTRPPYKYFEGSFNEWLHSK